MVRPACRDWPWMTDEFFVCSTGKISSGAHALGALLTRRFHCEYTNPSGALGQWLKSCAGRRRKRFRPSANEKDSPTRKFFLFYFILFYFFFEFPRSFGFSLEFISVLRILWLEFVCMWTGRRLSWQIDIREWSKRIENARVAHSPALPSNARPRPPPTAPSPPPVPAADAVERSRRRQRGRHRRSRGRSTGIRKNSSLAVAH